MTEEIKKLGAQLSQRAAEVEALRRSVKEEEGKLIPDEVKPEEAKARLKELLSALYKAEAELQRVQTDYKAKVAEWRHGSK